MVVHLFLNNNKALDFLPINSIKNGGITIQEIETRPNSNIHDVHLLSIRDELRQHLDFDEHELMFIGELIDVKEAEKSWQGAIERALGGLKTTLMVTKQRNSLVTHCVNARHN